MKDESFLVSGRVSSKRNNNNIIKEERGKWKDGRKEKRMKEGRKEGK